MAHSPIRDVLVTLSSSNSGDPEGFLEGLSDIHVDWHGENVRTYGFLLFHHRVVRYFNAIVNPALGQRVIAFDDEAFQEMGTQPFAGNAANADSLAGLRAISQSIESWHNNAHLQIASATGAPMMDASQNIFFRPFWQLHLYVEALFQTALEQYANQVHPAEFLTIPSVAGHIEATHHSWVPQI